MMPRLRQFTEISRCPVCVNLQRFHDALFASIYRDFMMPRHLQTFYKHFILQAHTL